MPDIPKQLLLQPILILQQLRYFVEQAHRVYSRDENEVNHQFHSDYQAAIDDQRYTQQGDHKEADDYPGDKAKLFT